MKNFLIAFLCFIAVIRVHAQDVKSDGPVFTIVEEMPEFPGGSDALYKFISSELKYPESAVKDGTSGTVYVTFVVTKDGNVKDAKVIKGVRDDLNNAAVDVVKQMPVWTPGKQGGKAVSVQYNLPIHFSMGNEKTSPADKKK